MFNEVINYKQIVKHEFWNFLKILLKENRLRSEDKSKLAKFVWELSSGSLINSCDVSLSLTTGSASKGWRQCWLAMSLFTFLYKNIDFSDCDFLSSELLEENISLLQEELHFKSLLDSLEISNSDVEKELCNLHTRVCHSKLVHRLLPCLSDLSIRTLEKSMREWPGITHLLINRILCSASSFHDTNNQLFQIYKFLIDLLTKELCTSNCDDNRYEYQRTLLSLIALCDDKRNVIDVHVCNSSSWINEGQLRLSLLLLAVISHEYDEFYLSLCENEDDYHNRKVTCLKNQKQDEMILCNIHNKLFTDDGSLNISELFLRSFKNKTHWLEDIICLYSQLLIDGELLSVDVCFLHPLFLKLRPLLVFQLWMYSSAAMNRNNLNLICSILDTCKDLNSDLVRLSEVLRRLKFVIEWVDEEVKVSIPDVNTLLGPARNQSILHLLKSTTDISQLNPLGVKDFLKQAHNVFDADEDIKKELSIFEGFCIMTTILRGIFEATNGGKGDPSDFKGCHPGKKLRPICEKTIPSTIFQNIREQINEVCSLGLRLEILENIFSLLFLRREDLREDATSDSGAEEDDNNKQSGQLVLKKCSTQSVVTQSLPPTISSEHYLDDSNYHLKSSSLPLPTTVFLSSENKKGLKRRKSCGTDAEPSEGFLCTNQLVNDLLVIVKDSLTDITKDAALLEIENKIEYNKIEPRLNRLSEALTAGLWRFELLSKISTMDVETHVDFKSEWIYVGSEGSDSDMEVTNEKPISKRQKRSTESADKSSESGSNTAGAGASYSVSKGGRKLKKKKSSWKCTVPFSCSLINLMLASPSSLASYFLSLKDISGASSVIKVQSVVYKKTSPNVL